MTTRTRTSTTSRCCSPHGTTLSHEPTSFGNRVVELQQTQNESQKEDYKEKYYHVIEEFTQFSLNGFGCYDSEDGSDPRQCNWQRQFTESYESGDAAVVKCYKGDGPDPTPGPEPNPVPLPTEESVIDVVLHNPTGDPCVNENCTVVEGLPVVIYHNPDREDDTFYGTVSAYEVSDFEVKYFCKEAGFNRYVFYPLDQEENEEYKENYYSVIEKHMHFSLDGFGCGDAEQDSDPRQCDWQPRFTTNYASEYAAVVKCYNGDGPTPGPEPNEVEIEFGGADISIGLGKYSFRRRF